MFGGRAGVWREEAVTAKDGAVLKGSARRGKVLKRRVIRHCVLLHVIGKKGGESVQNCYGHREIDEPGSI